MTERDLTRILTDSVQDVHLSDDARRRIRLAAKEGPQVKKKMNAALALVLGLMMLTTAGLAANLGMFDFLTERMGAQALPGATSVTDLALAETDVAAFYVTEAAFDGRGASVMVKVVPKDEKTFLIGEGGYMLEDPAICITGDAAHENMTIAEYVKSQGYEQLYEVSGTFLNADGSISVVDQRDGSGLTLVYGFAVSGEKASLSFEGMTCPYDSEGNLDPAQGQRTEPASFTLKAEAPLWTAQVTEPADVPEAGIRIDRVTLTGTKLGTYAEIAVTIMDTETCQPVSLRLVDADGQGLRPGMTFLGGESIVVSGTEQLVKDCVAPLESAPEVLHLSFYDFETNTETFIGLPVSK